MHRIEDLDGHLRRLAERLVARVTAYEPSIREGIVLTIGPPPYRRLDCDGRALAYVRTRPRKRVVRVDVSGLWHVPMASRLAIPSSNGSTALVLRDDADVGEAVAVLTSAVAATRAAPPQGASSPASEVGPRITVVRNRSSDHRHPKSIVG